MGFKKRVQELIKTFDLFAQPVSFRYADEPAYESVTGGICSIIMIAIFVAIFTGTTINTLNKKYITSTTTYSSEINPSFYTVGSDSFMFAIGITGINLNEGERWFDVYLQFRSYDSNNRNKTFIPLQPCQKSQWTSVNKDLGQTFDRLKLQEWLCPQTGLTMQMQGKYTSDNFKFYKLAAVQCDPALIPERACVNDSVIEQYLQEQQSFTLNFYFINSLINPGSKDYLSHFLDDFNYFPFSNTAGLNANLFISEFLITTDQSIYPFEQVVNDTGGIILDTAQTYNYDVQADEYLKLYLRKSSISILVERSFRKADDTLSYIGGLFSAILAILIIMTLFNQFSYELEVAKNLYHYESNKPIDSEGFNFLVYLGYLVYLFFDKLGISLPWKRMASYHHSLEEVRKQMDIRLVMKKILYSQRMAYAILDEHKAKILHLQEPLTLEEAELIRKDHRFYQKLQMYFLSSFNNSEEQGEEMNSYSSMLGGSNKKIMPETEENVEDVLQRQETMGEESIKKGEQNKEEKDKKQFGEMIDNMRTYMNVLQNQAANGDHVSERILQKFDPRIKKQLTKIEQQERTSQKMLASDIKQRKLNFNLNSPLKYKKKRAIDSASSLPNIRSDNSDQADKKHH